MNESISEIQRLLQEIVGHLKSGTKADTRKVVAKLERIAALASTLAPHGPGTKVAFFACWLTEACENCCGKWGSRPL
jgi:hypothetical protein